MANEQESLEQKVKKPDWKQWLPIYGMYKVEKDFEDHQPTILDGDSAGRIMGTVFYHSLSLVAVTVTTGAGLMYAVEYLAEKLF